MANKRKALFLGLSIISISPLLIATACSNVSYQIIIPKILDQEKAKIKEEITKDTFEVWSGKLNTVAKWIKTNENPSGYITGGNVNELNILSITPKLIDNITLEIVMKVDPKTNFRFIENKIEHIILINLS